KLTRFAELDVLPRNKKPISKWANRDKAWAEVFGDIQYAYQTLQSAPICMNSNDAPEDIDLLHEFQEAKALIRLELPLLLWSLGCGPGPSLKKIDAPFRPPRGKNKLEQWKYVCDRLSCSGAQGLVLVLRLINEVQPRTGYTTS